MTKDMTLDQARAEAVRRWGAGGTAQFFAPRSPRSPRGRLARYPCVVRNGRGESICSMEGQGRTWTEAFADARPVTRGQPLKRKRPGSDPGP